MFDSQVYDLVITDVLMPGIDGRRVARHIRRSNRPNTPVIGISGTPWLLQGGIFDSVIDKPFNIQALTKSIGYAVGKGSKLQTLPKNKGKALGFHGVLTPPLLAT